GRTAERDQERDGGPRAHRDPWVRYLQGAQAPLADGAQPSYGGSGGSAGARGADLQAFEGSARTGVGRDARSGLSPESFSCPMPARDARRAGIGRFVPFAAGSTSPVIVRTAAAFDPQDVARR